MPFQSTSFVVAPPETHHRFMGLASWRRLFAAVWILSGAIAGGVSYALGQSRNLLVFLHAARALLDGRDLYAPWLDFFKYSPTFALLFVPFTWMPEWLAAVLWGALNFGLAYAGLDAVVPNGPRKPTAFAVALAGVLLATDGDQSNLLVVGLILLGFAALEKRRVWTFALLVGIATHVKLFPAAAMLFVLLHPRWLKSGAVAVSVTLALALLPLLVVWPRTLAGEYASWAALLGKDHANHGWSIMCMLEEGFGFHPSPAFVQALGAGLLAWPLLAGRARPDPSFRRLFAASVLVFSVLFNHRSEYATYVVSAIGVGIWYAEEDATPLRRLLVALAIVAHGPFFAWPDPKFGGPLAMLTSHRIFHPMRTLPLACVWALVTFDLLRVRIVPALVAKAQLR
jgi:hypothetical protein